MANFLACRQGFGTGPQFDEANLSSESLSVLRLKPEDLDTIGAEVTAAVEAIAANLSVK